MWSRRIEVFEGNLALGYPRVINGTYIQERSDDIKAYFFTRV